MGHPFSRQCFVKPWALPSPSSPSLSSRSSEPHPRLADAIRLKCLAFAGYGPRPSHWTEEGGSSFQVLHRRQHRGKGSIEDKELHALTSFRICIEGSIEAMAALHALDPVPISAAVQILCRGQHSGKACIWPSSFSHLSVAVVQSACSPHTHACSLCYLIKVCTITALALICKVCKCLRMQVG